jgi:recombination protein RecR
MARADFPIPVRALIDELKRLPGIGPRSAERMAVWLLQNKKAEPKTLAA